MNITRATLNDLETLAEIQRQSIKHFGPRAYSQEQVNGWLSGMEETLYDILTELLELQLVQKATANDGVVVGFCSTHPQDKSRCHKLYIIPEAAGTGAGPALLQAMEDDIRPHSPTAWLSSSLNAVPFYEKYGYTTKGEPYFDHVVQVQNVEKKL